MGKPPAFQLYAADFYMDTGHWTIEEIGIYTRLLLSQWINIALPDDPARLARLSGCSLKSFLKRWSSIEVKFTRMGNGQLQNLRLEEERQKQLNYRNIQSIRAKKRWDKRDATALPTHKAKTYPNDALQSSSSFSKKKKIYTVAFEAFWSIYPRKEGTSKLKAFEAWEKLNGKEDTLIPVIMSAIDRQIGSIYKGKEAKWIPHAATWLNEKRWEGEEIQKPNTGGFGKALF